MKQFLSLVFLVSVVIPAMTQENCGTDAMLSSLMRSNPGYRHLVENRPAMPGSFNSRVNDIPDTIPVVVHVIYMTNRFGEWGNITDDKIDHIINVLNGYFNDTDSRSANIGLYFKLAQTDPDCRPTNGIVRVDATNDLEYSTLGVHNGGASGGISHEDLAKKSYWDNTKYFNIWIVTKFSNDITGYAFYPPGVRTVYDGMVLRYDALPIIHEMGHAFNLYHIFEGSSGTTCAANNNCAEEGDHVCDTPPMLVSTGCDIAATNPCTNLPYGYVVFNHMAYSCGGFFTAGQRDRMRNALYTYRTSLLASNTEWPPPPAPSVSITSDDADNIINKKQLVLFTPTVNGNPTIQYHWLKNNFEVSTERIYSSSDLNHGDEIVCMIEDPSLVCHVPVRAYSNKIKISTDPRHFVNIYPNPAYDIVSIWTPSEDIKINMIRVFSTTGQLIGTKIIDPTSRAAYSLKNLPTGLYFLEFTTNKGRDVVKVMRGELKIF